MMINIITLYSEGKTIKTCRGKNDDFYHKGREGGGHRVMIEIIISENDDNDGRPLRSIANCVECRRLNSKILFLQDILVFRTLFLVLLQVSSIPHTSSIDLI